MNEAVQARNFHGLNIELSKFEKDIDETKNVMRSSFDQDFERMIKQRQKVKHDSEVELSKLKNKVDELIKEIQGKNSTVMNLISEAEKTIYDNNTLKIENDKLKEQMDQIEKKNLSKEELIKKLKLEIDELKLQNTEKDAQINKLEVVQKEPSAPRISRSIVGSIPKGSISTNPFLSESLPNDALLKRSVNKGKPAASEWLNNIENKIKKHEFVA